MKRFIISILCVSVFFVGLGALVDKAGANFRSDEKALALVRQARVAIGGDSAIAGVQSLRIVGQTTRNIKIDGTERAETGETEIALQLPDKLMKTIKIGGGDSGEKSIHQQMDVVVVGSGGAKNGIVTGEGRGSGTGTGSSVKKIVIKKDDGTEQVLTGADADKFIATEGGQGGDHVKKIIIKKPDGTVEELKGDAADKVIVRGGDKAIWTEETGKEMNVDGHHVFTKTVGHAPHDAMRHNELLRLTLGLLLTAPQGMDVSYTFGGESSVDGTACNIIVAEFGGSAFKIYLGQTSNLPVMMAYKGMPMPTVMKFRTKDPNAAGEPKDNLVFTRKVEGPAPDSVEYSVKFSDYRSTGGVQLPYKWTQTVGGTADETFDVTSYEVNPANIAEKFHNQKVMVRTAKPDGQK